MLPTLSSIDARLVLQVLCGLWFLPHTIAKLRNIPKSAEFFDKIGFRPPKFFSVLTATMEFTATVGLVTNLYPKIGALIAATILFVAAWAQAKVNGVHWRWQFLGAEYMLFWGVTCLVVGFLG